MILLITQNYIHILLFLILTIIPFIICIPPTPEKFSPLGNPYACINYYKNETMMNDESFNFCDMSLSEEERLNNLCNQLTTDELLGQMNTYGREVQRLGLPNFNFTGEGLHGILDVKNATSFTEIIGLTATFNKTAWEETGMAISSEIRGIMNYPTIATHYFVSQSMFSLIGNINIFIDPRWGRGQETSGEDPWIAGEFMTAYNRGFRGSNLDPYYDQRCIKVATGLKHILAYNLECTVPKDDSSTCNTDYPTRINFNGNVTNQDLYETFLPAWEKSLSSGDVDGIMCAFVAVNGIPMCANKEILDDIVRKEYGFDGIILPDYDAIFNFIDEFFYSKNFEEATAAAIDATVDLDTPLNYLDTNSLTTIELGGVRALKEKLITESQLIQSCKRINRIKLKLGLFNPIGDCNYSQIKPSVVESNKHLYISLSSSEQSMTLLKNNNNTLPLPITDYSLFEKENLDIDSEISLLTQIQEQASKHFQMKFNNYGDSSNKKKIALIGYSAQSLMTYVGDYSPTPSFIVNVKTAFDYYNINYEFSLGNKNLRSMDTSLIQPAVDLANDSDLIVLCLGLGGNIIEGEGHERQDLLLPGVQSMLLSNLTNTDKPIVIVLINGGPIDISYAKNNDNVKAILEAYYPAQMGGLAIVNTLFGFNKPAGRLPYTIYPNSYCNEMDISNQNMRLSPGRTYKFYTGTPVYEYGYGLSYTTFKYSNSSPLEDSIFIGEDFRFVFNVTNTGKTNSDLVILGFSYPNGEDAPLRQLIGYDRIHLNVGETKTVYFFQEASQMGYVNKNGKKFINSGLMKVTIGDLEYHITVKPKNGQYSLIL